MLLILEIVLTITAWRKGWRWRALLPVGIGLGAAFLLGIAIGLSGGTPENAFAVSVLCDLGAVIALIVLVRRTPAGARAPVAASAVAPVSAHAGRSEFAEAGQRAVPSPSRQG